MSDSRPGISTTLVVGLIVVSVGVAYAATVFGVAAMLPEGDLRDRQTGDPCPARPSSCTAARTSVDAVRGERPESCVNGDEECDTFIDADGDVRLTEEAADARDAAEGRQPYETPAETAAREGAFPVEQYESQEKATLVAAAVAYLDRSYPSIADGTHAYRLAVLLRPTGGIVDVEWYRDGKRVGLSVMSFSDSGSGEVKYVRGYDPR